MERVRARGAAKAFDRQLDQGLGPVADRVARLDAQRLQPGGRLGKPGLEAAVVPDGFQQQIYPARLNFRIYVQPMAG